MAFPKPNYTQTPNLFFDESLPKIKSLAELKVILAVVRQTFGWRKGSDKLSHSQLSKITGLTRRGVINGVNIALEHGFLEREPDGQSFIYRLALVNAVHQLDRATSEQYSPELVNGSDHQLVNSGDTQKKEKEKKETSPAFADLFSFHAGFLDGPIPDRAAQGKAIKLLLENYTPEECKSYYSHLRGEEWRTTPVTWLTVKRGIGDWLARGRAKLNGHKPKVEVDPFGEPWMPKPFTAEDAILRSPGKNPDDVRANFEGRLEWKDVRCL